MTDDTDQTNADIGRDIVLLTAILNNVRHGKSTVSDTRRNSDLDLWSCLSFVLTTGSSEDPHGNKVVAVTGRIEPDSVAITAVSRNTSVQCSINAPKTPVEVDAVTLDSDGAEEILGDLSDVS